MDDTKIALMRLLIEEDVLRFGEFELKSGRLSPYFFNLGAINSGAAIEQLGAAYARVIQALDVNFDIVFGPAYKGIPIAVSTAVALARGGLDVGWAFNRKETKAHGEGGQFVGAAVNCRVLLVDDVLTAGTALREAAGLVRDAGGELVGVVIALDRQERLETVGATSGTTSGTAVTVLATELGVPVVSLLTLSDVIEYLDLKGQQDNHPPGMMERIRSYQAQYCDLGLVSAPH